MADLAKLDRAQAAESAYRTVTVTERDRQLIANVIKALPVDNIDQWLALGGVCPYWPNQRRERQAWTDEIHRQRDELRAVAA